MANEIAESLIAAFFVPPPISAFEYEVMLQAIAEVMSDAQA